MTDTVYYDRMCLERGWNLDARIIVREGCAEMYVSKMQYLHQDHFSWARIYGPTGLHASSYRTDPVTWKLLNFSERSIWRSAVGIRWNYRYDCDAQQDSVYRGVFLRLPLNLICATCGVLPLIWLVHWDRRRRNRAGFPLTRVIASDGALP